MSFLRDPLWSPYVVGVGIGLINILAFLLSNKPLGCSTSFSRTSGMIENIATGGKASEKPYYQKIVLKIEWQWMLVIGIFIGALLSAVLSGTFKLSWTPGLWIHYFGETPVVRVLVALAGGILMGLGARWAGGCTSGHGISGTAQLAVSGWIAAVCFFAGGILTAILIFNVFAG